MGIFAFSEDKVGLKDSPQEGKALLQFADNLIFGDFFKIIVKVMLENCGYEVLPYGFESNFPSLKGKLVPCSSSNVACQIRFTPDLLVNLNDTLFEQVEVKARSVTGRRGIQLEEVKQYKEHWPSSILVLVIDGDNYFYAQRVCNLPKREDRYPLSDFYPLEKLFPLAHELSEQFRCRMVKKARALFHHRHCLNL